MQELLPEGEWSMAAFLGADEDVVAKITDYIKANKSNMDKIKPIIAKAKELGYENPTMIDKIEDAKEVLALIS